MKFVTRSKTLITSGALALMAAGCVDSNPALTDSDIGDDSYAGMTEQSSEGRYIIQFKNDMGRAAIAAAGGTIVRDLAAHSAAAAYMPDAAVQGLLNNPNIEYVEADQRRYPMAEVVPFGVPMVQADQVPAAPATGDSGRIVVCVIDSGISGAHEDLASQPMNGTNNSGTGNWYEDTCGHGTHVAGTIAATTGNGLGVASVAPAAASLHIVKVFDGVDCGWGYSSDLVAALDACVAAGSNVVSMSLGGSFKSRTEDQAFANAYTNGVLSIAAAGNDGSTGYSYPASYSSVVSVAAIDSAKVVASFSQNNDQVELAAPGVAVKSTYPYAATLTAGTTRYDGNGIEGAANGTGSGGLVDGGRCLSTDATWSGKVVLCERGDISFYDKVMNVQNSGGTGTAIYNNVAGNFFGTLGTDTSAIPAISLSQENGQALVANNLGQSSSVFIGSGDGYADLDGTSMATPHVSAVAALIWAQVPSASNSAVRDAMRFSAADLGTAGYDNSYGYGLVQAKAALDYLASGGGGDDGGGGTCSAAGATCSADSECCSAVCKGKGNSGKSKTCQ